MWYREDWAVDFCGSWKLLFPSPIQVYMWKWSRNVYKADGKASTGSSHSVGMLNLQIEHLFPVNRRNSQFSHLFYFLGWLRIWFAQIIRDMLNYIPRAIMQEFLDLLVVLSKLSGASNALVNIPKVNIQIIWVPNGWRFLSAGVVSGEGGETRGVYCY